jgi:hypothetical protein
MLDTADKTAGPLLHHMPVPRLARFVGDARRLGLIAGLAGSLRCADVPILVPLGPDYLGFRSALTRGGRSGPLDPEAVGRLRAAILKAGGAAQPGVPLRSKATATAGAQSAAIAATGGAALTSASKPR